jgi:hypothetical protein
MSKDNLVSIEMKQEDLQAILDAIAVIKTRLPNLVALTPGERKELAKMGDKTIAFVEKSLEYAESNAQIVPPYVNVPELRKDIKASEQLNQVARALVQLSDSLNDTALLAGSEAYKAALAFYNSVKAAAKMDIPGTKPIYDDLSKRFAKSPRKKNIQSNL